MMLGLCQEKMNKEGHSVQTHTKPAVSVMNNADKAMEVNRGGRQRLQGGEERLP